MSKSPISAEDYADEIANAMYQKRDINLRKGLATIDITLRLTHETIREETHRSKLRDAYVDKLISCFITKGLRVTKYVDYLIVKTHASKPMTLSEIKASLK